MLRKYELIFHDAKYETSIIIKARNFDQALAKSKEVMAKPDPDHTGKMRIMALKEFEA